MAAQQTSVTDYLKTLETEIEKVVLSKSIPALPDNVKELIVKISPWFAAISMIMLLPLILAAFGISAVALPFSYLGGLHMGFGYTISLVFTFGMIVLELMALPGLFKRKESAWRLMFYSTLLSLVQQLFRFDVVGLLIGGVIGFYILFQVKSKYTK
ncbi:MAG: chromate transporter [Microgenomates group bacterium]